MAAMVFTHAFVFGPDLDKDGTPSVMGMLRQVIQSLNPAVPLVDQQKTPSGTPITNLHDAIAYLTTSSQVTRPIGNLLLGTHATSGKIKMPMFPGQGNTLTQYEQLQQTIDDNTKSIAMSATLIGPPQIPSTHNVRVFGCNIGTFDNLLLKWREALGGNADLIAPRHFDGLTPVKKVGIWEFLCYRFSVYRPEDNPFPNDAAVRAAFKARAAQVPDQFKFRDGNPVPATHWDDPKWYRPKMKKNERSLRKREPNQISTTLVSPVGGVKNVNVPRGLMIGPENIEIDVNNYTNEASIPDPDNNPADVALCIPALTNFCNAQTDKKFEVGGTHKFPVPTRYGYDTFDDFIAGFSWDFKKVVDNKSAKPFKLHCTGRRLVYTVMIPITDVSPAPDKSVGKLLTNFHADSGVNLSAPDGLALSDPALYNTQ